MDKKMENGRHWLFNFIRDTPMFLLEKLNIVFDSLNCAAKLNDAFRFVLTNVEDGFCRYYYEHETITL